MSTAPQQSGKPFKPKKVWKGEKRSGPAPARHIPWPEVFKHHISVVEGHMKMMEMVQKHTVPNTGNHKTISEILDRCREMLRQSKHQASTFVPPAGYRENVPLGSSSESMYPGYSPAHIEYGQASMEAGSRIGSLRAEGREWKPPADGPEYQVGQGHGGKRKLYIRNETLENGNGEDTGKEKTSDEANTQGEPVSSDSEQPLFVIDPNPTPLVGYKRAAEETPEGAEKKKKKAKNAEPTPAVESEDISADVEASLKAKKKSKSKDGKRRRDSDGSEVEKKSKKSKKEKKDKALKRDTEDDNEEGSANLDGEGEKKKKKRKKNKESKESKESE